MIPIVYHEPRSPASRLVILTARSLKIDIEVKLINLAAKVQYNEDFLKLNPLHKVPVLIDGDYILIESRAIIAYLVNSKKINHSLYPTDAKARGLIDSKLYFDATIIYPGNYGIIKAVIYDGVTKITKAQTDTIVANFKLLDNFLVKSKYFAGNIVTLADLAILANVVLIDHLGYNFMHLKNLSDWYERCRFLPGFDENSSGAKISSDLIKSLLDEPFTF